MKPFQTIRDYIFEEKIGEGGMGEVWLARHVHLERAVAVKVLSQRLLSDPKFEARFLQEAKAMARLQHPRIVGINEFFNESGEHYLVMPYIGGGSLESRLRKEGGPLPVEEALSIAADVLSALDYAHQKGVIHRDVKPSNILLDGEGHAHLTDFGIALMVGEARTTRTGTAIGTPHYMSPEQIARPKALDHRSDVYSFACVLYEMLTGQPPFDANEEEGDTDFLVKEGHLHRQPAPLRRLRPALAEGLETAILMALSKDPDQRFSGCGAFARAIQAGAQGRGGAQAKAAPQARPAPSPPQQRPPQPARGGTVVEGTPGPDAGRPSPPGSLTPQRARVEAPVTSASGRKPLAWVLALALVAVLGVVGWIAWKRMGGSSKPGLSASSAGQTAVSPKDGLTYVYIPPGVFQMGCVSGDSSCSDNEKPRHAVTISKGFWMGRTEVTVTAYKRYCAATGRSMPLAPSFNSNWLSEDHPMVNVSWDDARAYCEWAGGRLPTEAEWEYAARAGTETAYYWGNSPDGTCAWYNGNSGSQPHPVGQKKANGWGLSDMAGNACEWCSDWFDQSYYASSPGTDPTGPGSGQKRVMRGGSWYHVPNYLRPSGRLWGSPDARVDVSGFRCLRDAPP